MLSTLEKVIILKGAAIFAEAPDATLAEVATLLEPVELAAGQLLFAQGEPGTALYVVVAGAVRIHSGEHTLIILGEHEALGEMALLDDAVRSAAATAVGETMLLRLERERFLALVEEDGSIARGLLKVLAQRLRARSQELAALSVAIG
jgi:CRP-like cAMP-binding protein